MAVHNITALLILAPLAAFAAAGESLSWMSEPPVELRKGDLVFRRGQGFWTKYFVDVSTREKRFSHVGVVWKVSKDKKNALLIHADADDSTGLGFVHKEMWKDFFERANSLECVVFRWDGEDSGVPERLAEAVHKRIRVPFDPFFDMSETNKLYCTELIAEALKEATATNFISSTMYNGREFIAIDDIYRINFRRIYDSKDNSLRE